MTVGAIADKLLAGTNAEQEVKAILSGVSLSEAAVWADCAKAVDTSTWTYKKDPDKHPECAPFETAPGQAAMIDFVKRNATNCAPKPGEELCHKQYHYADISIRHQDYKTTYQGARSDDVIAAITAAIAVLQGEAPKAPFSIKDKREALLILAHCAGDIHQPLHVGAVYLDPNGKVVNPDAGPFDPATETRGGNLITVTDAEKNLHATWDAIPEDLQPANITPAWLNKAKAVPKTAGPIAGWSSSWATDTQKQAVKALAPLKFKPKSGGKWSTKLSCPYTTSMTSTKKAQLTKAGARLAQLLTKLWPGPPVVSGGPH